MDITYIFHSGFLIETADCHYIFDYWKGSLPALDTSKPVFVFASHGHADHYNPEIFGMLRSMGMKQIIAVLAKDIPQKRWPESLQPMTAEDLQLYPDTKPVLKPSFSTDTTSANGSPAGSIPTEKLSVVKAFHSQEYDLPCHTHVQTLLSTDSGVAYLITCPEGTVYHAGDLNDWNIPETPEQERRQMTGSYRASVNKLKGKTIDIAFLPLDPRLEGCYADGFLYFLKNINVRKAFPMHYWEQPETIGRFLREYPQYRDIVADTEQFAHSPA